MYCEGAEKGVLMLKTAKGVSEQDSSSNAQLAATHSATQPATRYLCL